MEKVREEERAAEEIWRGSREIRTHKNKRKKSRG